MRANTVPLRSPGRFSFVAYASGVPVLVEEVFRKDSFAAVARNSVASKLSRLSVQIFLLDPVMS